MDTYLLGDTLFCWDGGGYALQPGIYMPRFRCGGPWDGDRITLRGAFAPLSAYLNYPKVGQAELYDIYDVDGEKLLLYHWGYKRNAYGIFPERVLQGREDVCFFDPGILKQLPLSCDWFFGVSGLQKALLHRDKPVFHASYIDHRGSAILFAAPSETGKSTQAALWEKYAGTQIINGDRVLLGKRDGLWHAYGYPCCGSSDICVNRTLPLKAIVMLAQGSENKIEQLRMPQKIRMLAAGIAVYSWAAEDVDKAFALAAEIAAAVPVIRLVCRPDQDAVNVLRRYLEETDHANSQ